MADVITINEGEDITGNGDADDWISSLEVTARRLTSVAEVYWSALSFGLGAVVCFYGRHFTYSYFFWRTYASVGWPATQRVLAELRRRYTAAATTVRRELPEGVPTMQDISGTAQEAVTRFQAVQAASQGAMNGDIASAHTLDTEMEALQEHLASLQQWRTAFAGGLGELEPQSLPELLNILYCSLVQSLSTSLCIGAKIIGVKRNLGDVVAKTVNQTVAPQLYRCVDTLVSHTGEEIRELRADSNVNRWVDASIRMWSNSLGIAAAFCVEALAFTISNSRVGADLMASETRNLLVCMLPEAFVVPLTSTVKWFVCAYGIYFQFGLGTESVGGFFNNILFGRKLSMVSGFVLGMPLILESCLKAAVAARRGGILV